MWRTDSDPVDGGSCFRLLDGSKPLTFRTFFRLLRSDEAFSDWYTGLVAGFDADAFYWELPPLKASTLGEPAEFVLIAAPGLARMLPDPAPFEGHFRGAAGDVVVFGNLGGDATLVVPCPKAPASAYPHFAAFLRGAPPGQVRELWRIASKTLTDRLGERPIWLSTAGGGVAWLHLRLDSRPKYYSHRPYAVTPA